jgi:hypothetical protein
MTAAKLRKMKALHASLQRKGGVSASEVQELAVGLGRTKFTGRGKEPTWINASLTHLRPLSIPDHGGGKDLKVGTKNSILNQLQEDIDAWTLLIQPLGEDDD